MTKPHIFPFAIAYADTDAGGIVYHGRYIEIAERARMDWLRPLMDYPDGDLGFVITELSVKYLRPLHLGDRFVVETTVTAARAVAMALEQKFVKDGEIYAIINVTAAYLGRELRPRAIPDNIRAAIGI